MVARWAGGIALIVTIVCGAAAIYILKPRETDPQHVDAVLVLAFGEERIAKGRELGNAGVADVVVFSRPSPVRQLITDIEAGLTEVDLWFEECGEQHGDYLALCLEPDPETTFGEAKAIATFAQEQGWDSLAVVTDVYHLGRATALVEQCFAGEVFPVATYPEYSFSYRVFRTAYEIGAYGKGLFTDQTC